MLSQRFPRELEREREKERGSSTHSYSVGVSEAGVRGSYYFRHKETRVVQDDGSVRELRTTICHHHCRHHRPDRPNT